MRRPRRVALVGVSLAMGSLALAGVASASSESRGGGRHQSTATPAGPTTFYPALGSPEQLERCNETNGRCRITYSSTNQVEGDMVGVSENFGALYIDESFAGWAVGMAEHSGTVKGCDGPGTSLTELRGRLGADGSNVGTWKIVEGSGTGGLTTLRGSGTYVTTISAEGAITYELEGSAHCK